MTTTTIQTTITTVTEHGSRVRATPAIPHAELCWAWSQHPVYHGPSFVGWRGGRCYPARRADLSARSDLTDQVFGSGPGIWRGLYHGLVPVVIVDPEPDWPPLDSVRPYTLFRGRPVPPAP